MRRALVPLVVGAMILVSMGSASTGAVTRDWTQFAGTPGHTRAQRHDELISVDTVLGLERAWSVDLRVPGLENSMAAGPSIADGQAFAAQYGVWDSATGTARSEVVALDLASGRVLWRVEVPGTVHWTPAVSGDTVVVAIRGPGDPMTLVGLGTSDGLERWSAPVICSACPAGQVDVQPPVVDDGIVVATLGDSHRGGGREPYGYVRAYDVATGTEIWGRAVPAPGMPVIADGAVVVSHESRRPNRADTIWALELDSGVMRWRRSRGVGSYVFASAVGRRIFATTGSRLLALSTVDGATRWARRIEPVLDWASVGSRTALLVDRSQPRTELLALDPSTGAERWALTTRRLGADSFRPPWIVGRVAFLPVSFSTGGDRLRGERRGGTFAVRTATGRVIGRTRLHGAVGPEQVAVADGFVVIARDPARLVAFTVPVPPEEG